MHGVLTDFRTSVGGARRQKVKKYWFRVILHSTFATPSFDWMGMGREIPVEIQNPVMSIADVTKSIWYGKLESPFGEGKKPDRALYGETCFVRPLHQRTKRAIGPPSPVTGHSPGDMLGACFYNCVVRKTMLRKIIIL